MDSRSLLLAALLLNAPAAALAQEPVTVGPPELRNFELPGTRTSPPAAPTEQPPAAARPAPSPSPTPSPARTPTARREQAEAPAPRPTPAPRRTEAPAREQAETRAEAPLPVAPTGEGAADVPAIVLPDATPPPLTPPIDPPVAAVPVAAPAEETGGWLGWAAAALALLAAFGGLMFLRRRRAEAKAAARVPIRQPARPEPVPAPSPPAVPAQPEPRIELDFRPERVVISDEKAEINFKLDIRNSGAIAAEDVRISVQTFNAADKAGIDAFLADTNIAAGPMPWRMPAGYEEKLEGIGKLDQAEIRAIEVQGRRLLIPVVAFNTVWRLPDGRTGQTALSFLVGRESDPPAEKMGAFRLDLGPRLYRTVGQRLNLPAAPKPRKKVRVRIEA